MSISFSCDKTRRRIGADEAVHLRIVKTAGAAELRQRFPSGMIDLSPDAAADLVAWLAGRDVARLPAEGLTKPPARVPANHRPVPVRS